MPVVNAHDPEDPSARAADRADLDDGSVERGGLELIAAVALGLQAAKEPGLLEVHEGLVGQATESLGLDGALTDRGK
jgi:hypothetical protein